ncbi:selenide,water dikinase [Caulobacter ginsengisoli]|uniref:Selenide, water dikinase n=1 Tax=Caulobacter ginsengisoli TaxID=400775 RepID=A0ABU0IK06_9CAUL|nr:selenide, water dikinase SelD [Caulobacter ginsengisoli]MDQ0462342.1 selenide,water dikinase [Caulobacter ginsengisoli]
MPQEPRLTSLAHGGGCGCKLAPGVLSDVLSRMPVPGVFPDLLVGTETSDDAAVWRLSDDQALVATTDFFMPVVDDPTDFGRIAATNALSDVYAMGGRPIFALAIVGMPVGQLSPETIGAILAGGASVCAEAGIPVAGGHSIDSVEPIYGLVALGLVDPKRLKKNSGGQAEDVLILTKPIGVGVLSAAFKQEKLTAAGYAALIATTTQLNKVGPDLALNPHVHAMTDVTGFGLLGHALEMARGAGLTAEIEADAVPLIEGVLDLAREGVRTGASGRNWASYGASVDLPVSLPDWRRDLLTDPQTSGGLLIAVSPEGAAPALARARAAGFSARSIGRLVAGPPRVRVI